MSEERTVSPHISPAFYCNAAYAGVYCVMLTHPSSTYCCSTTAEAVLASLVSTNIYDVSLRKLVKCAG